MLCHILYPLVISCNIWGQPSHLCNSNCCLNIIIEHLPFEDKTMICSVFWQHISWHLLFTGRRSDSTEVSLHFKVCIICPWGVIKGLRANLRWLLHSAATRWQHLHYFHVDTVGYVHACTQMYVHVCIIPCFRLIYLYPPPVLIIHSPWRYTGQSKPHRTPAFAWSHIKYFYYTKVLLQWKYVTAYMATNVSSGHESFDPYSI